MKPEFQEIFERLRAILQKNAGRLTAQQPKPTQFCLVGGRHPKHKTPMPIAWVQIGKNYVSYHLMPVYAHPRLLAGYSDKLKARMQGKSCFNFKVRDDAMFEELDRLTAEGFVAFAKAGYMKA
ncbi:MAG TPA: hypothetical protein VH370_24945 [Humisphaera sp.]|jgi:hypothetical protein|nr:hypothetical protein [Humisphaera sp.]